MGESTDGDGERVRLMGEVRRIWLRVVGEGGGLSCEETEDASELSVVRSRA